MKICISKYAGFCDGVNHAYETVKKLAENPQTKKPICVLGSLVHNADVVKSIEKLGVEKIDFDGNISQVVEKLDGEKIGTLVITAHGIGPKIFSIAEEKGINVVDTTCPKVIKAQRLAEVFWKRAHQIVIIGKRKHKETMGIFRWARKKANIVESEMEAKELNLSSKLPITIVAQTTQNKDRVDRIVELILQKYPQAEVLDTVCETTKRRQEEAKKLALENDVVLIIGSPDSSNSTELWQIAKAVNPQAYFIERAEQIKRNWFEDCRRVGITAGASSPDWVIKEVVKVVENM